MSPIGGVPAANGLADNGIAGQLAQVAVKAAAGGQGMLVGTAFAVNEQHEVADGETAAVGGVTGIAVAVVSAVGVGAEVGSSGGVAVGVGESVRHKGGVRHQG